MLDASRTDVAPEAPRRLSQGIALSLAAVFGAWAGSIVLRSDDVGACVFVVLGGTFLVGAFFPRDAWGASLLVAGCVPFAYLYAMVTAMGTPSGASFTATILAFIPSFLGAAAGILARRITETFFF